MTAAARTIRRIWLTTGAYLGYDNKIRKLFRCHAAKKAKGKNCNMTKRIEIKTDNAPKAIGPYSQGIRVGDFVFTSGQIPINPKTGALVSGGIDVQAKQVFENLKAVLSGAGMDFSNVVKTTIFLKDINDFAKTNEIYEGYFVKPYPARSCVEVAALPKDVLIEVELIAAVK